MIKDIDALSNEAADSMPYIWQKSQAKDRFWLVELPDEEKNDLRLDKLENALEKQDFRGADIETGNVLKSYLNHKLGRSRDWISYKDVSLLPIELLYEVDQLWMFYSDKNFGITPQYEQWKKSKEDFILMN